MEQKRIIGPVTNGATVAGGVAGALSIITVWLLSEFVGIETPTEVGMALTVVIGYLGGLLGGWAVRPQSIDYPAE